MEELKRFVGLNVNDKFWLLRKAISIIAYFTQLSYKSLKNLKMQDLQTSSDIYVQTLTGKVQISNPEFTSIVTKYYETVINDSKQPMGPLFRHYHQKSDIFTKTPLGTKPILDIKNEIQNMTK